MNGLSVVRGPLSTVGDHRVSESRQVIMEAPVTKPLTTDHGQLTIYAA
jgi:hypothetical protein